jgi:hypothetical protein
MSKTRCASCGYTEADAKFNGDHRLCKNDGNAPWQKGPNPTPVPAVPAQQHCPGCDEYGASHVTPSIEHPAVPAQEAPPCVHEPTWADVGPWSDDIGYRVCKKCGIGIDDVPAEPQAGAQVPSQDANVELLANDIMKIVTRGWEPQGKIPVANYNRIFAEVYTLLLRVAHTPSQD